MENNIKKSIYVLEKEMATHSSILAWKIPWKEESGGLYSMGSHSRTGLSTRTAAAISQGFSRMLLCAYVHEIPTENLF